jgi:hypothetical protein
MVELMVEVTVVPSLDSATGGRIMLAAAVAMLEKDEGADAASGTAAAVGGRQRAVGAQQTH